jgi:hypothetical protein
MLAFGFQSSPTRHPIEPPAVDRRREKEGCSQQRLVEGSGIGSDHEQRRADNCRGDSGSRAELHQSV